LAALSSVPALAQAEFTADATVGGGAATNPYLVSGAAQSSATVTASIQPHVVVRDTLTTFRLDGEFTDTHYFSNYDDSQTYSARASVDHVLSSRASIRGSIGVGGGIVGVNQALFNPTVPEGNDLPPIVDDVTLDGLRQRRQNYQASLGVGLQLSPYDSIDINGSASAIRFSGASSLDEYNYFSQQIGYSRRISAHTQVGVTMNVGESDYLGTPFGDGTIYSPSLTFSTTTASNFTIEAAGGVSVSKLNTGFGRMTSTSWTASLSVCRRNEFGALCVYGTRATLPSSLNGVRSQSSLGLGYTRRIGPADDIAVNASYSNSSEPLFSLATSADYVSSAVTWNHRFGQRLFGFVSAGYSDAFQSGFNRRGNFQANVGLRIRLGKIR